MNPPKMKYHPSYFIIQAIDLIDFIKIINEQNGADQHAMVVFSMQKHLKIGQRM